MNCRYYDNDFETCKNGDCPYCADYCPVTENQEVCRYSDLDETEIARRESLDNEEKDSREAIRALAEENQELKKQLDWWKEQNFKACYEKSELSGKIGELEKQLAEAYKTTEKNYQFRELTKMVSELLQKLTEAEWNHPIELSGQGAENFCLAAELSEMQQELEKVKAEKEEAVERLEAVRNVLSDPIVLVNRANPKKLRPVKSTRRQDVYQALLKAQMLAGVAGRWFPEEWVDMIPVHWRNELIFRIQEEIPEPVVIEAEKHVCLGLAENEEQAGCRWYRKDQGMCVNVDCPCCSWDCPVLENQEMCRYFENAGKGE